MPEALDLIAIGSETEYTLSTPAKHVALVLSLRGLSACSDRGNLFSFNNLGGRLYPESPEIPEYATPECLSLDDLVLHEIAGEDIAYSALMKLWERRNRPEPLSMYKRTCIPNSGLSVGSHENYSTRINIWNGRERNYYIDVLAAHLATRTIYTGQGMYENGQLRIGQKPGRVGSIARVDTVKPNKPLVNMRAEHHVMGASRLPYRLHVTSGDANISPLALKLKFGSTKLMLRMLHANWIFSREDMLENPVTAAREVASGVKGITKLLKLQDGTLTSALRVQNYFFRHAENFARYYELPPDEQEALELWGTTLQELDDYAYTQKVGEHIGRLDWMTLLQTTDTYERQRQRTLTPKQLAELDIKFTNIPNGIGRKLRAQGAYGETPTKEQLHPDNLHAPIGRAMLRGLLVKESQKAEVIRTIDWDAVRLSNNNETFSHVSLGPPERIVCKDEAEAMVKKIIST